MSRCDEYLEQASRYLDGELPRDEEAGLLEHLKNCSECRRYFSVMRAAAEAAEEVPAPEGFAAGVMEAVRAEAARSAAADAGKRRSRRAVYVRFAAAAACLVLVAAAAVKLASPANVASPQSEPAGFGVTGMDTKDGIYDRDAENDADEDVLDVAPSAASSSAAKIESVTVTAGEVVSHTKDEALIAGVAELLEFYAWAESQPGSEADYVIEFEGASGERVFSVWIVDGELLCRSGDELWIKKRKNAPSDRNCPAWGIFVRKYGKIWRAFSLDYKGIMCYNLKLN